MLITELKLVGKECLAMARLPDDIDLEYFNINDPDNASLKMIIRTELLDKGFSVYGDHWMVVEDKSGASFLGWVKQTLLKNGDQENFKNRGWFLDRGELVHTSEEDENEKDYTSRIEKKMHMPEENIYDKIFHHVRSFEEKAGADEMVVVFLNKDQAGGKENPLNRYKSICVGVLKKDNY